MASVLLVVAIAVFYLVISTGWLFGGDRLSHALSCATKDSAFLPAASYGNFVKFLDGSHALGFSRFDAGFSGDWRGQGFYSALALEPRYRAENEAIARSWGYQPLDDRPRLPLSGSIVLEHPGLLEVYQTVSSLTTEEEAARWMIGERGAPEELVTPSEIRLIQADEVIVRQNEPAGPEYETTLGITMRVGKNVMALSLQGGSAVTIDQTLPLVQEALSRIRAECGSDYDASVQD